MKEWIFYASEQAIVILGGIALIVILVGTLEACFYLVRSALLGSGDNAERRDIWLGYARWLVAGLTFQLAADIIETSIHSDWQTIGRIAAVAAIRTFLNYFLERDMVEIGERQRRRRAKG